MSGDVTAVVLVGGRSSRMGIDKALIVPIGAGGRTLTELVLDALAVEADYTLLAGRALPELDVPAIPDRYFDAGPLGGITSALAEVDTPLALVAACDMPAIVPALLRLLLARARAEPQAAAVMCATGAGLEPLLSAWRPALALPGLRAAVATGVYSLRDAVGRLPLALVLPPEEWRGADPEGASFRNWNTPEDLPTTTTQL
ncbi:MAG TPA: molybdenum cofactor guanylyltransferase [Candidatus Angelobacter sp.]|nr:molybdenum cofactor guanylyltransferase [Candidatus Angelobacter sp.]